MDSMSLQTHLYSLRQERKSSEWQAFIISSGLDSKILETTSKPYRRPLKTKTNRMPRFQWAPASPFFSLIFLWAFPFPSGFFSTWKPPAAARNNVHGDTYTDNTISTRDGDNRGQADAKVRHSHPRPLRKEKKRQEGYVYAFASHDTPSQDA